MGLVESLRFPREYALRLAYVGPAEVTLRLLALVSPIVDICWRTSRRATNAASARATLSSGSGCDGGGCGTPKSTHAVSDGGVRHGAWKSTAPSLRPKLAGMNEPITRMAQMAASGISVGMPRSIWSSLAGLANHSAPASFWHLS